MDMARHPRGGGEDGGPDCASGHRHAIAALHARAGQPGVAGVGADAAVEVVGAAPTEQLVVTALPPQGVGATEAAEEVVAASTVDGVAPDGPADHVVTVGRVLAGPEEGVDDLAAAPGQPVPVQEAVRQAGE